MSKKSEGFSLAVIFQSVLYSLGHKHINIYIYFSDVALPECHLLELLGAQGLAELLAEES